MSSGGTPYIGSKISLISKAKIRYEGFLYTIDTEESTVTLAKVKSFGTEDRPAENRFPERNEIYEYIVFRGSDIDDLHVSEGPKSRGNQVAQDPAIVQTGTTQPNMYQGQMPMQMGGHFHHQSYGPFGGIPTFGYPIGFRPSTSMPLSSVIGQNNERNQRSSPFERSYRQSPSPPGSNAAGIRHTHRDVQERRNLSPDVGREQHARDKQIVNQMEAPKAQREQKREWRNKGTEQQSDRSVQRDHEQSTTRRQNKENEQLKPRYHQKENEDKSKDKIRVNSDQSRDKHTEQSYPRNTKRSTENKDVDANNAKNNDIPRANTNSKDRERASTTAQRRKEPEEKEDPHQKQSQSERGRGRARGMRRGRGRGSYRRTRFDQDFDFESSNAKFNKEEVERELLSSLRKNLSMKDEDDVIVEKEAGKTSSADDDTSLNGEEYYYDKTKSFFDQISCDSAKERPDSIAKRRERALNTETFGMVPRNYRGRPYRGRGGRGGSRGRGYGRGHRGRRGQGESRAWVDYEFDFEAAGLRQGSVANKHGGS